MSGPVQGPISKWNDPVDSSGSEDAFEPPVDTEAAAQAHINALAGACLALGIKYAGTAHPDARGLLHNYVLYFLSAKQGAPDPVSGEPAEMQQNSHVHFPLIVFVVQAAAAGLAATSGTCWSVTCIVELKT